jgi:diaminopropionate ammonia-lyase
VRFDPQQVLARLARCPQYRETPLHSVKALASTLEIEEVWVKDESQRMGLGSFKALGGAYAVARKVESDGQDQTFCCASAGNHGLSVAAGAQAFHCPAVILLSNTVPEEFAQRIRSFGAQVLRAGATYEESMREALRRSERHGWILVSDSSWPGYLEIPRRIMEGYTVIAWECAQAFRAQGRWPTHVFLQAGVGGVAAAMTQHIRESWDQRPKIVVVEPDRAACLLESFRAGKPTSAKGAASNMGRLDCKEPSLLAFEILYNQADQFLTVTDTQALKASRVLTSAGFPTTPSGAAGWAGALTQSLDRESRVLILVTESDPAVPR